MVRTRPIDSAIVFRLGRANGLTPRRFNAGLAPAADCPTGLCRRHRTTRSKCYARSSDLHPDGADRGVAGAHEGNPAGWLRKETAAGVCRSACPGSPVFRVKAGTAGTCERGDGGKATGRGPS